MRLPLAALTLIALAAAPAAASRAGDPDAPFFNDAASACKAEDYRAFVDAVIASPAVRRKYSAATIDVARFDASRSPYRLLEARKVAAAEYRDFPIRMVDHYRKSVVPLRPGDTNEHVILEFNQSQDNRISVEWTRVHYDGKSDGGDDLGRAFGLDGQPYEAGGRTDGQLLLYPTATCWELVADNRYAHR